MQKQELKSLSNAAIEDFAKHGVNMKASEYEAYVTKLIDEFCVSQQMAVNFAKTHFMEKYGVATEGGYRENPTLQVGEVNTAGAWINIEAKCVEIWEPRSDKIKQTGLVGDPTGKIKFVIWQSAETTYPMELNEVYRLENVVVNEYQGRYSLSINKKSTIIKIDREMEVASGEATVTGAIVGIQYTGSGIIKRCTECNRVLQGGICPTDGKNKGVLDLRVKAVLDDGTKTINVIFGKEITEGLVNMPMDEIKQLKAEGDEYVFNEAIDNALLGQYKAIKGYYAGDWFIAESLEQRPVPDPDEVAMLYDMIKQEYKKFIGGESDGV